MGTGTDDRIVSMSFFNGLLCEDNYSVRSQFRGNIFPLIPGRFCFYDYDEKVFSFMIGVLLLSEQAKFLELTGIFLIITGNIFVLVYEGSNVSRQEKV